MPITKAKMEQHVLGLCRQHSIEVLSVSRGGKAWRKSKRIKIAPVKGVVTYYVALHEIAHVIHPEAAIGKGLRLEQEAHAWNWAIANALVKPTPAVTRLIHRSLVSYLKRVNRRKSMKLPNPGHLFWTLLNSTKERNTDDA
jgi:hypothetical protein